MVTGAVPDAGGFVEAGGGQQPPVRAERHRLDRIVVGDLARFWLLSASQTRAELSVLAVATAARHGHELASASRLRLGELVQRPLQSADEAEACAGRG